MCNKGEKSSNFAFSGQQHVRLESPARSRHRGARCPQPCKRTPLQMTHTLQFPSCRRCFPAEDTHTLLHPAETPAGPGILATFETRSLSTSLKKVPAGAQVYWIYWCFQPTACIALQEHCIALRCIVLNFKLHVCNLILEPANTVVDLKMLLCQGPRVS